MEMTAANLVPGLDLESSRWGLGWRVNSPDAERSAGPGCHLLPFAICWWLRWLLLTCRIHSLCFVLLSSLPCHACWIQYCYMASLLGLRVLVLQGAW